MAELTGKVALVSVSETCQPSPKAARVAGLIFRRSRLSPIVTSNQCMNSLRLPAFLVTGADLRPPSGLRYSGRRVLFGFLSFERLRLSVPMERLTSGFSSGSSNKAESSGRILGFFGFTLGR